MNDELNIRNSITAMQEEKERNFGIALQNNSKERDNVTQNQ